MRSILYWSFLILGSVLLAYLSPFSLSPLIFLAGAFAFGAAYFSFLSYRRGRSGVWEHKAYQSGFVSKFLVYVMVFWTTNGLFTNVKEQREFQARYEPYIEGGSQRGYTFYYLDYEGSYERIDSPELNALISQKNPGRVRMVLETVKDFGRLRAYSVRSVESIPVDKAWTDGNPPWTALRKP
jgi:hypothetical protein